MTDLPAEDAAAGQQPAAEPDEPPPRSPDDRRKSVRELVDLDPDNLAIVTEMAKEDKALASLTVGALLRRNPEVEPAHVRYAFEVVGVNSKAKLRDIDSETARQLVKAASEARVEGDPTIHYPFWDEPDNE